jgi:hypothetical protein
MIDECEAGDAWREGVPLAILSRTGRRARAKASPQAEREER